jgi:hypothetical protein
MDRKIHNQVNTSTNNSIIITSKKDMVKRGERRNEWMDKCICKSNKERKDK